MFRQHHTHTRIQILIQYTYRDVHIQSKIPNTISNIKIYTHIKTHNYTYLYIYLYLVNLIIIILTI